MTELAAAQVAVLYGGSSSEREVSLQSGAAILQALRARASDPLGVRGVELTAGGAWLIDGAELGPAEALARLDEVELFFLGLHGGDGEDGTLQGLLRAAGKAFTGSDVGPSAIAMDKVVARQLAAAAGLRVARGWVCGARDWSRRGAGLETELEAWDCPGWIVKPRSGGSSVATALAEGPGDLRPAVERVLAQGCEVLIEERVLGVEATVPVLGNRADPPQVLPLVEIRPKPGRFFDYREKYDAAGAAELCPPVSLDGEGCAELGRLGLLVHEVLGLDGYSRADFMVPGEGSGAAGEPVFLEVNTLPGMAPRSLFPQAAAAAGIDFGALCERIGAAGLRATRGPR